MRRLPLLAIALAACVTEPPPARPITPGSTDAQVLALAMSNRPWTWWRRSVDTLPSSRGSGHGERFLRTRYDARAATQLDADGRVRATPSFPDSSLIVKELYTNGRVTTLAVMFKQRGSPSQGAAGWLWAEYDPAGIVKISVDERGSRCSGCHQTGAAVDFTRMNDSFR